MDIFNYGEQEAINLFKTNENFRFQIAYDFSIVFAYMNTYCTIEFAETFLDYFKPDKEQLNYITKNYGLHILIKYALKNSKKLGNNVLTYFDKDLYQVLKNDSHLYVNHIIINLNLDVDSEQAEMEKFIRFAIDYTPDLIKFGKNSPTS